ncbi:hypothetical protein GCM10010255_43930 [Streptomyces coeruleofuscus]|uniref:Uncharacterized protein n=1 Tax=Streptomyces coeruleofuscus TaxID=66879 RepID=A0ABN3IHE3_9ACTN
MYCDRSLGCRDRPGERAGDLAVAAVITALYPAATVLPARGVLAERILRGRLVGLGTAVAVAGSP